MSVTAGTLAGASVIKIVLFLYSFLTLEIFTTEGIKIFLEKILLLLLSLLLLLLCFHQYCSEDCVIDTALLRMPR